MCHAAGGCKTFPDSTTVEVSCSWRSWRLLKEASSSAASLRCQCSSWLWCNPLTEVNPRSSGWYHYNHWWVYIDMKMCYPNGGRMSNGLDPTNSPIKESVFSISSTICASLVEVKWGWLNVWEPMSCPASHIFLSMERAKPLFSDSFCPSTKNVARTFSDLRTSSNSDVYSLKIDNWWCTHV